MSPNRPGQYATDANLRARQRLWEQQQPRFDLVGWVLDLALPADLPSTPVLDVGCGNGAYLDRLRERDIAAVGCDVSIGMLGAAGHPTVVNADLTALPFRASAFDVVLAPHMLYHVADRPVGVAELRRALRPSGRCVVITNGVDHTGSLRSLVESAVRASTPGWEMRNPSTHEFSLENGEAQLRTAFEQVAVLRPPEVAPVVLTDAAIAADYVASVADVYQRETTRPWREVVDEVRASVQHEIDATGGFLVRGDPGAFICR